MKLKTIEVVKFDDGSTKELKNLDGWEWALLLREQPQFIGRADLSKLDGDDWSCLLREQPQLEKYRKKKERDEKQ